METTDYCDYKSSLALKEAEFDEPCDHYWCRVYKNSGKIEMRQSLAADYNNDDWYVPHCSAPTLWQAQKWLRDKKGILIWTYPDRQSKYDNVLEPELTGKWRWEIDQINEEIGATSKNTYPTYEAALSAGIDAALKYLNSNKK